MNMKWCGRLLPMLDVDFGGAAPEEVIHDPSEGITEETEEGGKEPEVEEVEEPQEPFGQTMEESAEYAAMRRELEQRERELQERNEIIESLFQEEEDPLLAAKSYATGKTQEEIQANAQMMEENERISRELEELRQFKNEMTFRSDLEAIKGVHPELKAETIDDIGEEFVTIMATGKVDPVTAYEIVLSKQQRETKKKPPEIGKVNQSSKAEKAFYTIEEVQGMSQEEVSQNWEKIQKSRTKWK